MQLLRALMLLSIALMLSACGGRQNITAIIEPLPADTHTAIQNSQSNIATEPAEPPVPTSVPVPSMHPSTLSDMPPSTHTPMPETATPTDSATAAPSPGTAPAATATSISSASEQKRVTVTQVSGSSVKVTAWQQQDGEWAETRSCDGYIGANGLSADRREGDKTTPSGTFSFGTAFGILSDPGDVLVGYRKVTSEDYWVCDGDSKYYNQWRSLADDDKDWDESKSEHLIDYAGAYDYAIAIRFNAYPNAVPGKGSAIFLHCYSGKTSTSGCIAVPKDDMLWLLRFIDGETTIEVG